MDWEKCCSFYLCFFSFLPGTSSLHHLLLPPFFREEELVIIYPWYGGMVVSQVASPPSFGSACVSEIVV
jgi:hypothetical protein